MRSYGTTRWFNDSKGFGFIEPKAPAVKREKRTLVTSGLFDDGDLRQWERSFNKACGLQ